MIRRVITLITCMIGLYTTVLANQEMNIKFDDKEKVHTERLGFAYLNFEYLYKTGNLAKVMVTVENITHEPPLAILVFKPDMGEKGLTAGKPKIEFEKKYPGQKGKRYVQGCKANFKNLDIIPAAETEALFTIDIPLSTTVDVTIPMYIAKYNPKDLYKKGKKGVTYTILEENIYTIHLEVTGWTEQDETYVNVKNSVESFIASLQNVEFCSNTNHQPSLKEQQRPYQERKDSLINVINNIVESNYDWMSTDPPYKAYEKLVSELNGIDLNANLTDCGEHKKAPQPAKVHKCNYCSLSDKDIYYRLDDLYQGLHAGRITKEQAVKSAKGLYNCYQQNKSRKKDSSYSSKIKRFYSKITGY